MRTIFHIIYRSFKKVFSTPDIRFSFLSILAMIFTATVLLTLNIIGTTYEYNIGDIATEDIRVPSDIYYVNASETQVKQKIAAESVPIVFDKDDEVLNENLNMINTLFKHITTTLKDFPPVGIEDVPFYLMVLKQQLPKYQQYNDAALSELLSYQKTNDLKKAISQILISIYEENEVGLLDKPYDNPLNITNKNVVIRTVNTREADTEVEISEILENLKTVDDARKSLVRVATAVTPHLPQKTMNAVASVAQWNLRPNLRFNQEETKRRIDDKVRKLTPVMSVLKKGQTLVREGDTITSEIKTRIDIYNKHTEGSHLSYIVGTLLIQIVFLLTFGFFLMEYSHILIPDRKSTMIILSLVLIFMVYAFSISRSETVVSSKITFALLLPIPFVTMIVSILYNMYLAMMVGVFTVFFAAMLSGGDLSMIIISFSAAVLGVFVNANVDRRTDFLRGGFVLGFMNTVVLFGVTLLQEIPLIKAVNNILIAFGNGFINAILVLGVLPLYENVFGITTKFKLLELSDLNADIFRQLLVEAPGTYNHSLIVATMAETACKDINANYMLARVGAYYHDIGKIVDATMYIENKVTDPRAKTMSPRDYSQLIISHVRKGVEIAKKNMLPDAVIDFIQEHHGNTTMTFFYHQALAELAGSNQDVSIDKTEFQYSGPKPHKKEIAIVMLADSIEAASRSLNEPTKEKLEGLVRKIIYNKLNDGELEYSDLSMTELNAIQGSFLKILNGIFHTRIEYPDSTEVKKLEKKVMHE